MSSRDNGALYAAAAVLGVALIGAFTWLGLRVGEDFLIPAIITLGVGGTIVLRGPVGKAIARRLEGGQPAEMSPEALAEVDELRARVAELEERMDFSERMLAQQREPDRIVGSGG